MNWGHDRGRDIRYKNCGESRQESSVQFGTVSDPTSLRIYSKVQEEPWNLLENLLIILELVGELIDNIGELIGELIDNSGELIGELVDNIGGTYEHWGTAPLSGLVKETTLKAL